ncbi:MAG: hypothetical protein L0Z50_09760 [Verrucomicrobiales bacterium]|nr:hypothetical protein [Verrucomicrobiales bacterium]
MSDPTEPILPSHLVSGFHSRNGLPHFKREGTSYFVTFRLAGTLPREVLLQLKAEREAIPAPAPLSSPALPGPARSHLLPWLSLGRGGLSLAVELS